MRIALFTDGIFPYVIGGMQKHSYNLAKYFAKKGVHIDLYHTNQSDKNIDQLELFTEDEKKNIHSIVIPFPRSTRLPGHYIKSSYVYSQSIFEEFKRRPKVDFIYTKGFSGWKLIEERSNGKWISDIPVGVNFHGFEMFQKQPSLKTKLQSSLLLRKPVEYIVSNADCVFSYGGEITLIIQRLGVDKNRILEIPTGIEESWLRDKPRPVSVPIKFIFVGRYERRKGMEELTDLLRKMVTRFDFEFEIVGEIPLRKRIASLKIKYRGTVTNASEMKNLISTCDVLVCPSYSEGMPNVILEGMANGLAVIASDVGAVSQLVSKENGFLIRAANKIDLANALTKCLTIDPMELDKMKWVSLTKVKKSFLWDQVIEVTLKKINDFIAVFDPDKDRSG